MSLLLAAAILVGVDASDQGAPAAQAASAAALLDALESAWNRQDLEAYLGLWVFADETAREEERSFARLAFGTGAGPLQFERPARAPEARLRVVARFAAIQEPRGRVEQHLFRLEARGGAWAIRNREGVGRIDGLVHLSLDPQGYRADGLAFRFEDFELRMEHGTLFLAPESLGPTVAVFAGQGTVHFRPRPETEREQLRQFVGRPELKDGVRLAFVRIHPADLPRTLEPLRLERDPEAASRWAAARRYFEEQAPAAFVLDASVPGAPWWVLPGVGDALVSFDLPRRGTLTYAVNADQPEAISLFNRSRRIQVCLYPREGGSLRYTEDDGRELDVLHHDLRVRFDPLSEQLRGEDTLTVRLLSTGGTVRLKLDDQLRVDSVTSPEGGRHLFFRVRHQDTLMVSLGAIDEPELRLTVRYSGHLAPTPVESELMQVVPYPDPFIEEGPPIEVVRVYSNRSAWYPQGVVDDYATARVRLDVPAGMSAVTGGERVSSLVQEGRNVVEYAQARPGKYITAAVGRIVPVGERKLDAVTLTGYGVSRTRSETERALELAADMVRFFSKRFGPPPYDRINLVVIEANAPGGHSPPGMLVLARRPPFMRRPLRDDPTNFSDVPGFFLAHELAHQWWGHGIAGQNYRERWLSESFAQYAAATWARQAHGEEEFQGLLKRMGRWAMSESHWGPISLGYRLGHVKGEPAPFRAVVYDKGAYVVHMLQGLVGEEAFFRALADFQQRFRYGKAGTDDLREALEAASGTSLEAYFQQWVHGTTIPALRFEHRQEKATSGYTTAVDVKARDLPGPLPLELAVFHAGGRARRTVLLPAEGGSFSIDSRERPIRVEINGDRGLLAQVDGR
ncbi:MAG TPA: M1 family aminopeptidase [Vicinamibacteria bacterium]|nr:M1 family aminopeptidase [Vicinamibacteria bacterium]